MIITRDILDMIEDYYIIGTIEIGDDYISISIPYPDDRSIAINAMDIEYKKVLQRHCLTPYRFYDHGEVRFYLKWEPNEEEFE